MSRWDRGRTMHSPSKYHTILDHVPGAVDWKPIARRVFEQSFRTNFDWPGFSLLSFTVTVDSESLRRCMITLKALLDSLYHARSGKRLVYQSMARFDQQVTTKFHLDGGLTESFLMLGYEPSEVPSALAMADYTLASWKMGIAPDEFIRNHNPMFASGAQLLVGTITPIIAFNPLQANLLIVNNSCLPMDPAAGNLLGVMHQATIPQPDLTKTRIVNSTMIRTASSLAEEELTMQKQQDYVVTKDISGPVGY